GLGDLADVSGLDDVCPGLRDDEPGPGQAAPVELAEDRAQERAERGRAADGLLLPLEADLELDVTARRLGIAGNLLVERDQPGGRLATSMTSRSVSAATSTAAWTTCRETTPTPIPGAERLGRRRSGRRRLASRGVPNGKRGAAR